MKTMDILELLKNYIILGLKILIPVAIIFFIVYGLIYKKMIKGTKTINKSKILLCAISICYIVIVIGATFFSRQSTETYNDTLNLNLFSSYREAYHDIGVSLLNNILVRNLILNIMLFIPLGFLLPLYSDKLKKMYRVVLIGFLATLTIELTQHFNDYGVFEIDDVFNNTLGTLLGYCCFMIFYKIKNKENWKKIIGYIIPFILTVGAFIGIYITYQVQEFGNFTFEHNYRINMNNVDVQSEVEFPNERSIADIYYIHTLEEKETRQIAQKLFERVGKCIDDNETKEFENTISYWTSGDTQENETSYYAAIKYIGGAYEYKDSSDLIIKDGNIEFLDTIDNASREEVEIALQNLGIQVPENAKFEQNERKNYIFSINKQTQCNKLIDGSLECRYYEDKTVKYVNNNILSYEKVKGKEIKSEKEAYEEILAGEFKAFTSNEINSIVVNGVQLEYQVDSKGYYVPVYKFDVLLNESKNTIYIKAIK